ncbi:hypothetical protein [Kitasatospora sp. NPDC005856]|uniref:hypothetical protein n=1 Tax=Kitasatospora sp. NPDC005856 TaxID=3154566 RepID=UPI0033DB4873
MFDPGLLAAFANGRVHAVEHMADRLAKGYDSWDEDTVTAILCQHTAPYVKSIQFNGYQEGRNGLDWLCWWRDRTGLCFGSLVQAKNLKRKGKRWAVGFDQKNKQGLQLDLLLASARRFRLPALYMLYAGTPEYRTGLECKQHSEPACQRCERAGVSVVSALTIKYRASFLSGDELAVDSFHRATPWEDLADPALPAGRLRAFSLQDYVGPCSDRLRGFLADSQAGASEIAKRIFSPVHSLRLAQFSAMLAEPVDTEDNMVFADLPDDRGHFSEPYFVHVLQGLRTGLPQYVRDAEQGHAVPAWVSDSLAGIVIIDV